MAKLTKEEVRTLRETKKKEMSADSHSVQIIIGMGTCGVAAGARQAFSAFEEGLANHGIQANITPTGCMGLCYSEPTVEVVVPDMPRVIYGNVDARAAHRIITEHIVNRQPVSDLAFEKPSADLVSCETTGESYKQQRIVLRNCGVINPESIDEYIAREGYAALEKVLFDMTSDQVIEELTNSGLRGRGGAGFPTGLKWRFTNDVDSEQKYIVCNADEGDPGAYMDRSVCEGDPHSILEAMTIAGRTVGAGQGYIYIRAEYPLAIERLERAIAQAREYGLLGEDILGSDFNFDIELRLGAGAFVCGEETALLASIEGKRGMPVPRPPFPAVKGLWGKPTVINNVETWANIPMIILGGSAWFNSIGTRTSKGTKVFALTGKINNSGLIEVPMGTTLREIIYDIGGGIKGGKKFKAAQTGGPSGGVIAEEFLDTPIDYESLQAIGSMMGSGGMIVMDEDDCMIDVTKFYLEFTVDESCGKCAPCRIGGRTNYNILDKISGGQGSLEDLDKLKDLAQAMRKASLCGLGQTAPNPVMSTLKYFEHEYLAHIADRKCPAGKCKDLLSYTIIADKCVGCTACVRVCPVNCISGEVKEAHFIDQDRCIKCGQCFDKCKFDAIIKA